MDIVVTTDLAHVARELGLPVDQVKRTVELLDEGNTVPFITRYRKDQTGGFDEEQVRRIQAGVTRARMLAERKQTILRSIESQGKLDPDLAGLIKGAQSTKRLEDLYLPYKPKKQTLATVARQRGLQPLADEMLGASPLAADLDLRAGDYLNPDVGLFSRADVLLGVGHLLAETLSERADLRSKLRRILRSAGKLVSTQVPPAEADGDSSPEGEARPAKTSSDTRSPDRDAEPPAAEAPPAEAGVGREGVSSEEAANEPADQTATHGAAREEPAAEPTPDSETAAVPAADATGTTPVLEPPVAAELAAPNTAEATSEPLGEPELTSEPESPDEPKSETGSATAVTTSSEDVPPDSSVAASATPSGQVNAPTEALGSDAAAGAAGDAQSTPAPVPTVDQTPAATSEPAPSAGPPAKAEADASPPEPPPGGSMPSVAKAAPAPAGPGEPKQKKQKKKKKSKKDIEQEKRERAFKDYFDFREDLTRLLPHRILAINRGERAKMLRVRIECDTEQMIREAENMLIPADHPHGEFLRGVIRDALTRLLLPSLEREIRRELTDKAEAHAVDVFARNLRHLLLTPPLHGRRVLAIDPGFRSGCKMAALDEFGNVLGHGVIHFVGRDERRRKARYRLAEIISLHRLSVVAIGNGSACRDLEQLVAEVISTELKDSDVQYCVVNEAGASVYSTSGVGREELPDYDATLRSAISIGRRLLDPLSELVKINPSNIGVGLYQHDVKSKHLRESLDEVVESCVNFVGVDVNTASPALLRYVSGLNQLTARRLYDYRLQHGPFKNREELKKVQGFGAATFVQSAGFLKVRGGDNPLDMTWIHPESYDVARQVLAEVNSSVADLPVPPPAAPLESAAAALPAPDESAVAVADETAAEPTAVSPPPAPPEATAAAGESGHPAPEVAESEPPLGHTELPAVSAETELTGVDQPTADSPGTESLGDKPTGDEQEPVSEPSVEEQPGAEPPSAETAAAQTLAPDEAAGDLSPPSAEPSAAAAAGEATRSHVDLAKRVAELDSDLLAEKLGIGKLLLRDVLAALARPGRDPREDLPRPVFRRGIVKIDDLEPGMELAGTVLNVVDFGVFVDIGLNDSALIHVSRLADRFVRDPHDVVSVGDVIRVWVVNVDKQRRRVSLTAIKPGTERPPAERRGKRPPERPKPTPPPREKPAERRPPQGPRPRPEGGRGRHERPRAKPQYKPPAPKPKPVVPITKAMKEGREPMRTFSDLQQFFQAQEEQTKKKPPKDVKPKETPPSAEQPPDEQPADARPNAEQVKDSQLTDAQPDGDQTRDATSAPEPDHDSPNTT